MVKKEVEYAGYPPFQEDQPPFYPDRPVVGLSVKMQWVFIIAGWVVTVAWAVAFCMGDAMATSRMGFFVNNVLPFLVVFVIGIPVACSVIGYIPPKGAIISFLLIVAGPFMLMPLKATMQMLFAYVGVVIMSFCFTAIHSAGAATPDEDGGDSTFFTFSFLQPAAIAIISALVYLWQFSIHCPLNYKVRYLMMMYTYTKGAIELTVQQLKGTAPKYDEKAWRVYKLNDVQYIRIMSIRVFIILGIFSLVRMLEQIYCPVQTVLIDGALFTWGDYKFHPFKYTKELPVCEW